MPRTPTPLPEPRDRPVQPVKAASDQLDRLLASLVDPAWYCARYPDVLAAGLDGFRHFIRHGLAEGRDPNRFFDSAWYLAHYPDVAASGTHPLLHYLLSGAAEGRNPHPRFDAAYYLAEHPEAAPNPLLFHLRTGLARGWLTERPLDIADYLPRASLDHTPLGHTSLGQTSLASAPAKLVVDVVIPVYRGLQETQNCLNSVLADPAAPLGRVIVVEDRSPEPELVAWLRMLHDDGRITLLRNRRNQGFVASVNRGMTEAGRHDVVLLNSDTEVPPAGQSQGWLARLAAQAYAAPDIASVSPFSNNATICGYPDDAGGPPAFGHGVAAIDAACRKANAGRWVEVPTTVGFCLYLRRDALDAVGLFDAEHFGLGYGEENDFCLRATQQGWRHRLACDVFVYHRGQVSFSERSQALSARAQDLLQQRYPDYPAQVARYVAAGASAPARFAVTAALFRQAGLPVILMVTHALGGGVRRHVETLVARTEGRARVLLLQATERGTALSVPALAQHPVLHLPADREADLARLLLSFALTRVHIHHVLGFDLDLRRLIQRLDVPFDTTLHDYFPLCPQINFLPWPEGLYCGEPGPATCNACIADRSGYGATDILSWRLTHAWLFQLADRVICPSADARDRLHRYGLADRAIVVPHEVQAETTWRVTPRTPSQGKLRIAVLGVLANHKGARTVAAVAENAPPGSLTVHLVGHVEDTFPAAALKLIRQTGAYAEGALPGLLRQIRPHVIWFPMSWPETYSYTLSAALESGLPIVATGLGSLPERLAGRPLTWLTDPSASTQALLALFERIGRSLPADTLTGRRTPETADFYADAYLSPVVRPALVGQDRRRVRVAILPEYHRRGTPATSTYLRLCLPLDHVNQDGTLALRLTTADTVLQEAADLVVLQARSVQHPVLAQRLLQRARETGTRLILDCDEIPPLEAGALTPLLRGADAVWAATPGLAYTLRDIRPDVRLMATRLDERLWGAVPPAGCDDPVRILVAGTDVALIEPVLRRLAETYGERITIDILGPPHLTSRTRGRSLADALSLPGPAKELHFHNLAGELQRSSLAVGVRWLRPPGAAGHAYPALVHWLREQQPGWQIGLVPLADPEDESWPARLPVLEFAALGLACVRSAGPGMADVLPGHDIGQPVANDAAAWHAAIDWLIRHREGRSDLGAACRRAFDAAYTLGTAAPSLRAALNDVLQQEQPSGGRVLNRAMRTSPSVHERIGQPARPRRRASRGG